MSGTEDTHGPRYGTSLIELRDVYPDASRALSYVKSLWEAFFPGHVQATVSFQRVLSKTPRYLVWVEASVPWECPIEEAFVRAFCDRYMHPSISTNTIALFKAAGQDCGWLLAQYIDLTPREF